MSLRLRLNLLIAVLSLGFLATLTWLQIDSHRSLIQEEIGASHRVTVQMLSTAAQASSVFGPAPSVMLGFLQRLGPVHADEIRLYSADGVVRYSSPSSTFMAGRHAPDWFEALMRPKLEATVIGLQGARIEIIPDASSAIVEAWGSMAAVFLLGLGFVTVLHAVLLLFLRRLLRPTEADARRLVATSQELAENREVMRLIQAGIEDERKRLARELHDELGQSVTAIRLIATSIARSGGAHGRAQGAGKINEIAAGLYDSVHRIVRELRPAILEQPDIAAALVELGREWRVRHPDIELTLALDGDLGDLGEALALAVFRSVQEALTNVLKHAGAVRVRLALTRRDNRLEVAIEDDGSGPAEDLTGSGRGLFGMRERVAALGGSLDAGVRPEGGFSVRIMLPLQGDSS
ncbi:MAG: histidine kinase [Betaproteobacteria bacterium]|nr:histidine kinase [Rhodocyclales bacterium]